MAGIGHNSGETPPHPDVLNQTAQNQIRSVIERVERLNQERAEVLEQIREVYAEAKGNGFDTKILRKVVAIRGQDRAKRAEEEAILDLYLTATGDLSEPFNAVRDATVGYEPSEEDDSDLA